MVTEWPDHVSKDSECETQMPDKDATPSNGLTHEQAGV